jgi:hypothetical protein
MANVGHGRREASDFCLDVADYAADLVKFVGHVQNSDASRAPASTAWVGMIRLISVTPA